MFPENWVQFVMKIVSCEDMSPVMISNPIFWEKSEQMSFLFLSADLSKKVLMLHLYFRRDQSVLLRSQEFFFQKKQEKYYSGDSPYLEPCSAGLFCANYKSMLIFTENDTACKNVFSSICGQHEKSFISSGLDQTAQACAV